MDQFMDPDRTCASTKKYNLCTTSLLRNDTRRVRYIYNHEKILVNKHIPIRFFPLLPFGEPFLLEKL
jgi:hypothetical protein